LQQFGVRSITFVTQKISSFFITVLLFRLFLEYSDIWRAAACM
jgi:hypothetical protein